MNQIDQQLQMNIVREIDGFLAGLDQMKIGFASKIQQIIQQMMTELENRQKMIEAQQVQISNMEKELEILRKGNEGRN